MAKEIILSAAISALAGCTTHYEYVRYPCPPEPILPTVTAQELEPLQHNTYVRLVHRELALREYARLLEVHCDRR